MGERLYNVRASERAKDILEHYMRLIFDKVGLTFDNDTLSELDQLVDEIILASNQG